MVICLGRGADLHMAQLMPLPVAISLAPVNPDWFYLLGFTFLVLAHPVSRPLNGCGGSSSSSSYLRPFTKYAAGIHCTIDPRRNYGGVVLVKPSILLSACVTGSGARKPGF